MIFKKPNLLFFLTSLVLFSCQSEPKEIKLTKAAIEDQLKKVDLTLANINPKEGALSCADYFTGCVSAYVYQIRKLDFIALEYDSKIHAEKAAKKLNSYSIENWAFDDITGEPVLEKYIVKTGAKKAQ